MERGYREQERPRRDEGRRDEGKRDGGRRDEVEAKFGKGRDVEDKFGSRDDTAEKFGETKANGDKPPENPKREKKPAPAPTGEPMIIVNVNDRLGTKASIPCMASDPISMFHPRTLHISLAFNSDDLGRRLEADWLNCVQGSSKRKSQPALADSHMRSC